jgi:hypothetical protein
MLFPNHAIINRVESFAPLTNRQMNSHMLEVEGNLVAVPARR